MRTSEIAAFSRASEKAIVETATTSPSGVRTGEGNDHAVAKSFGRGTENAMRGFGHPTRKFSELLTDAARTIRGKNGAILDVLVATERGQRLFMACSSLKTTGAAHESAKRRLTAAAAISLACKRFSRWYSLSLTYTPTVTSNMSATRCAC